MDVLADILTELEGRSAYLAKKYVPHYVSSYGLHCFNLMNQDRQIYWESANIPNQRLHILFVSPAGFMKSYYLNSMGGDNNAIFKNSKIHIGHELTMTDASFTGSGSFQNGNRITTDGAAQIYRDGIMMIDEFSAITNAFKTSYNAQMDSQMLAALDHGRVNKRVAATTISYTTSVTLWAGVQPSRFDLDSGFGRRFWYLSFIPTSHDDAELSRARRESKNIKANLSDMAKLWTKIDRWIDNMNTIESVEFSDDLYDLQDVQGVYCYEGSVFDRFALGWHLARYGAEKHIVVDVKDQELKDIIIEQKKTRDQIMMGIKYAQVMKIIETSGSTPDNNIVCMGKQDLIQHGLMLGWNPQQMMDCLGEMQKFGMITQKNNMIRVVSCQK